MAERSTKVTEKGGAVRDGNRKDPAALPDVREDLRFRHASGVELLAEFPVEPGPGGAWPKRPPYQAGGRLPARAEALRITVPELHARRRFAFLFTAGDLNRLCSYESPPSWSVVRWLLRVDARSLREKLEKRAAAGRWTVTEVRAELRRVQGPAHGGGRRPKRPATLAAGLAELDEAARRFERLVEAVLTAEDALAWRPAPASRAARDLRRELAEAGRAAARAVARLRKRLGQGGPG